jgi:hypothetical protein
MKMRLRSYARRLRILEDDERRYEAKLAALCAAVDEGDASGIAKGNVFERVRGKLQLPLTPAPHRLSKKRAG